MSRHDRHSYGLAAFAAAAVALWAGLPLVLIPFSAACVVVAVMIARVVHSDALVASGADRLRFLDGSHERIDDSDG
jgi:uncharacterized membrane protein YccC